MVNKGAHAPRLAAFGECAVLVRDIVSPTGMGDMPYIGLEHVGQGTLSLVGSGFATEVTSAKSRFKSNDVLFGKLRPYLRKVVQVHFDGICSTDFWVVRPTEGVDAGYLFHVMASQEFVDVATRGSEGTKMPRAKWDFVSQIHLRLPPLEEQQRIAAVLNSIDDAIEHTGKVIAAVEQLQNSLLHELLTHGIPGWHTEWKRTPSLGTIPASWQVARLEEVADVLFSSVDKKTVLGEIPVELCNYTDVFYNRYIRTDMKFMFATATPVEIEKWSLKHGDVLFTKDSEIRKEIGVPAYVLADMPKVLCGYHLGLARPHMELTDGAYLAELLRSTGIAKQFARMANGVTRFGLTLNATNSLMIPLPSLPEQRAIATLLNNVDETLEKIRMERNGLQSLKESVAGTLLAECLQVAAGARIRHG